MACSTFCNLRRSCSRRFVLLLLLLLVCCILSPFVTENIFFVYFYYLNQIGAGFQISLEFLVTQQILSFNTAVKHFRKSEIFKILQENILVARGKGTRTKIIFLIYQSLKTKKIYLHQHILLQFSPQYYYYCKFPYTTM